MKATIQETTRAIVVQQEVIGAWICRNSNFIKNSIIPYPAISRSANIPRWDMEHANRMIHACKRTFRSVTDERLNYAASIQAIGCSDLFVREEPTIFFSFN